MNKEKILEKIWNGTPGDYRSVINGKRFITIWENGTNLVPLESLTDKQIEAKTKTGIEIEIPYGSDEEIRYAIEQIKKDDKYQNIDYDSIAQLIKFQYKYKDVTLDLVKKSKLEFPYYEGDRRAAYTFSNELIDIISKKRKQLRDSKAKAPNRLLGKKITLILPNNESRNAQFAIVELDEILASHNEKTFASTKGYPLNATGDNVNDRNYEGDTNAQAQVVEYARNLQPERLINTSRTVDGTPIINQEGIVVSGNNRTMSTKLAENDYPEKYRDYLVFLCEEWESFGFKGNCQADKEKAKVENFKNPFLVRIDYDIPALTTQELAKYNQDDKKGKRGVDKTIEFSNILRENQTCQNNLPKLLNEFDTMSDFYKDTNAQKQMADMLLGCGLVTQQSMPETYYNGYFSQNGKNFLESVLSGIVLSKEAILTTERDGVKSMRQVVVNALPVLMTNQTLGKNSLLELVNEAIIYEGKIVSSGLPFSLFINQLSAFDDKVFDRKAIIINRLMNKGQRAFKRAIASYNNTLQLNQGVALFAAETVTPDEAFKAYIINEIPIEEMKFINQFAGVPVEKSGFGFELQLQTLQSQKEEILKKLR